MNAADVQPNADAPTTVDLFLGSALRIRQPRDGYRAGTDAVLLAALVDPGNAAAGPILDAGAGVGVVGLCVAARCPEARVVLLEREPHLVALACDNVARNGFADRVTVVAADIQRASDGLTLAGIRSETFATVLANPPYHEERRSTPPGIPLKASAHQMPEDGLEAWARFLCRMAMPGGRVAMIHSVHALPQILSVFEGRFGDLSVLPIHSREGEPAIRIIVEGVKGSRAPFSIKSGLVLHGSGQNFVPHVDAIFRHGAALSQSDGG